MREQRRSQRLGSRRARPGGFAAGVGMSKSLEIYNDVNAEQREPNYISHDSSTKVHTSSCERWVMRQRAATSTISMVTGRALMVGRRAAQSPRICLLKRCTNVVLGAGLVVAVAWGAEQVVLLNMDGTTSSVESNLRSSYYYADGDDSWETNDKRIIRRSLWPQSISLSGDLYYGKKSNGTFVVPTNGEGDLRDEREFKNPNNALHMKMNDMIGADQTQQNARTDAVETSVENIDKSHSDANMADELKDRDQAYGDELDEPSTGEEHYYHGIEHRVPEMDDVEEGNPLGHSPLFEPGELDLVVTSITNTNSTTEFRRKILFPFLEGYAYLHKFAANQSRNEIENEYSSTSKRVDEKMKDLQHQNRNHPHNKRSWKTWEDYFAFDDDNVKNPVCRRPAFYYHHRPNCNRVHELGNVGVDNKGVFVGFGAFREAWSVDLSETSKFLEEKKVPEIIIKQLKMSNDFVDDFMDDIRKDAMVMDLLSSSPRIVDMYGHCGTTVLVESLALQVADVIVPEKDGSGDQEDPESGEVSSMNDLSDEVKIQWAVGMSQALSDLHGYRDGMIVHCDVQVSQFMTTWDEPKIKLSDFNRAEVLLWDPDEEEYCTLFNGRGMGGLRSPEEYRGEDLTNRIDIYSFGNILYGLLTGRWPHYDVDDDYTIRERVANEELPFIDDRFRERSYVDNQLVQIIEACWEIDPYDRPNIFYITHWLEMVMAEYYNGSPDFDEVDNNSHDSDGKNAGVPTETEDTPFEEKYTS